MHCNASDEHASLSTPFSVPSGSYLHPHCEDASKQIRSPPKVDLHSSRCLFITVAFLDCGIAESCWITYILRPSSPPVSRRPLCTCFEPLLSSCTSSCKNLRAALDWIVLIRPPCFPHRLYIVPFLSSPNRGGKDSHSLGVLLASSPEWATHDTVPPRSRSEIRTTVKGTGKQL